jgi:hypothetical protein
MPNLKEINNASETVNPNTNKFTAQLTDITDPSEMALHLAFITQYSKT